MQPEHGQLDESLLLDLIEGNLDPVAQARLDSEVAKQPGLAARLEAMRRDRRLLQSGRISEPSGGMVERALQAAREPARIDETAAQWRRRYRHHDLRPRVWAGAAAAAAVIVIGCVWILLERQPGGVSVTDSTMTARNQAEGPSPVIVSPLPADEGVKSADISLQPADARDGHAPPVPNTVVAAAGEDGPLAKPDESVVVVMPVALVIRSKDAAATVASLRGLVRESRASAALVSNLTRESAHELQIAELMQRARPRSPATAGATGAALPKLGDRLGLERAPAERIATSPRARQPGELPAGEVLEGRRDLAASYLQQLEFADQGALLTLTIPVEQLNAWLAQVQATIGAATSLRPWGDSLAGESASSERHGDAATQWLEQLGRIRDAAPDEPSRSLALLPIVIEDESSRPAPRRP